MNAVVVYESFWGNTAQVARAIAEGVGPGTPALTTDGATAEVLAAADLIVAGAPLMGFSLPTDAIRQQIAADPKAPSPADLTHRSMREFLAGLPKGTGRFATFETGFKPSPGSAARKIARALESAGWRPAAKPERFLITGSYGPMREGEIERARAWGASLAEQNAG